jgi:hypothetical protein
MPEMAINHRLTVDIRPRAGKLDPAVRTAGYPP